MNSPLLWGFLPVFAIRKLQIYGFQRETWRSRCVKAMFGSAGLASVPDGCISKSTLSDWVVQPSFLGAWFVFLAGRGRLGSCRGTPGWAGHLLPEQRGQCLLPESKWQLCTSAAGPETSYSSAETITKGLGRAPAGHQALLALSKTHQQMVNPCHHLPWAPGWFGCTQPRELTGLESSCRGGNSSHLFKAG